MVKLTCSKAQVVSLIVAVVTIQACTETETHHEPRQLQYLDRNGKVLKSTDDRLDLAPTVVFGGKRYSTPAYETELAKSALKTLTVGEHLRLSTAKHSVDLLAYSAIKLKSNKILIVGGIQDSNRTPVALTWLYDPKSGSLSEGPNLATGVSETTLLRLENGNVLIVGGRKASKMPSEDSQIFSERTGSIIPAGSLVLPRLHPGLAQLGENVLIVGGITGTQSLSYRPGTETDTVELLNLRENRHELVGTIALGRSSPIVIPVEQSKVAVIGGYLVLPNSSEDTVWIEDWEIFAPRQ